MMCEACGNDEKKLMILVIEVDSRASQAGETAMRV
jgi:hypothetical protein